ncbi:hypothetical protein GWK47_039010 [Chionoecetes opilio]|uniref:Uncharacterized protein n=1 Tax=Chionoecetes opilio TaxID=41210 RepID=A0A8J4YC29_CHIOP|nr:hypothetical protein GWK47_039010 [Chionoecetes opilio]
MDIGSMRGLERARPSSTNCGERASRREEIVETGEPGVYRRLVLHWTEKLLQSLLWAYGGPHRRPPHREDDAESFLEVPASSDSIGQKTWLQWSEGGWDESGRQGTRSSPSVSTPRLRTLAWGKVLAFGLSKNSERSFVWLACRLHVHEVILKGCSEPASALPLVTDIGNLQTIRNRWPSWIPRRTTVETSEDLVEFFRPNDTASKLKDWNALAF